MKYIHLKSNQSKLKHMFKSSLKYTNRQGDHEHFTVEQTRLTLFMYCKYMVKGYKFK